MRRVIAPLALALGLVLAAGACSGSDGAAAPVTTSADGGPKVTFVTLGSSETSGDRLRDPLRSAWPQLLYRASFPRRAVYVNLGTARSTAADGVDHQLAEAVALHPTVATIWFGVSDAFARTPLDTFDRELDAMITGLRTAGARVLVILGPGPTDGDVDVTPYTDRATARAEAGGAEVVDLRALDVRAEGSQQPVADAVAKVLGQIS